VAEVSADLRYDTKIGKFPGYFKFGGRYRDRSKIVDRFRDAYDLSFGGVTAANPYSLTPFAMPTFEPAQGGASPFVHGVVNKFKTFIDNPANLQDRTRLVYDSLVSQTQSLIGDLNNTETIRAGYAMGVFDFNKFTVITGLRVEKTTTESNNAVLATAQGKLTRGNVKTTNSYTNLLPSVQLKLSLTKNFLARASWTNTLGRPDYSQLSGTATYNYAVTANPNIYTGSLTQANPYLKPYESSNFDVSFEHYMPKGGILAVGGFYKKIANQIYTVRDILRNYDYDNKTFEQLTVNQNRNADDARLYGVEFSYDQAFTFLPKVLNGLGLSTNFAIIGSKVNLPNRPNEDLPLFRQASNVYNAALYYQKKGFEFRVATSHRSAYLTEAANAASYTAAVAAGIAIREFDRYDAARTTYDISGSYTFLKKKMKATGQVRNLTNQAERGYQGNVSRYDRHDLTGRSFFLGVSLNL
jgi:TonB-dependent receptor